MSTGEIQENFSNESQNCTIIYISNSQRQYQINCSLQERKNFVQLSIKQCRSVCCRIFNSENRDSELITSQFCSVEQQSLSRDTFFKIMYGICGLFLFLLIMLAIIIFCMRRKKLQRERRRNKFHIQPPQRSQVKLEEYVLDEQGPYLINQSEQCAICLSTSPNLRTHCGHYYHGLCFKDWISRNTNNPCPLCVSSNFNPIKLYCQRCLISKKLFVISETKNPQQLIQITNIRCQNCQTEQQIKNSQEKIINQ